MEPRFAHPAEQACVSLFEQHGLSWRHEPVCFILARHDDGSIHEAFTPDFYLPELDVFIEVTAMDPRHASRKRRKVRQLRTLVPDLEIVLLEARDLSRLGVLHGLTGEMSAA